MCFVTLLSMLWFGLSILSVFSLAVAELTQQHLLNKENAYTERTSAVLTFLVEWLLSIPIVFLFFPVEEIFGWFTLELVLRILAVTSLASVGMIFYLRSFKVRNISFSQIFGTTSVPVSTALGIVFLSEGTSWLKFLGIILILLAIVALNYRNIHLEKNHFFGLLSGVIFGICFFIDKSIVQSINPIIYISWSFFLVPLFAFLFRPREVITSVRQNDIRAFRPIFFSAIGYLLYNIMTFSAYRAGGDVGSVDAINNTAVFLVILFEFGIMRHRHSLVRKLATALVAYIGVMLIGLAG